MALTSYLNDLCMLITSPINVAVVRAASGRGGLQREHWRSQGTSLIFDKPQVEVSWRQPSTNPLYLLVTLIISVMLFPNGECEWFPNCQTPEINSLSGNYYTEVTIEIFVSSVHFSSIGNIYNIFLIDNTKKQ